METWPWLTGTETDWRPVRDSLPWRKSPPCAKIDAIIRTGNYVVCDGVLRAAVQAAGIIREDDSAGLWFEDAAD